LVGLIAADGDRVDSSFRQALSPIAKKAGDIVARIRDEERAALDSTAMLDLPKHAREMTKTWQIIRRMPKGALLRAHCQSMADIDHLLQVTLSTPGMHISCPDGPLATAEARRHAGLSIQFRAKGSTDGCSLWTGDYNPGTFIPLAEAADGYPEGGRLGFMEWLKERCMIPGQDRNLRQNSQCANIMEGMLYYEPIWRAFLQRLLNMLADDGIYWLELR
jgi:adenosine deaminase CECR1